MFHILPFADGFGGIWVHFEGSIDQSVFRWPQNEQTSTKQMLYNLLTGWNSVNRARKPVLIDFWAMLSVNLVRSCCMLVLENTIQSFTHPFLRVSTIGYIGKEPPLTEKWSTKAHIPSTNFPKSPSKPIYQGISRNANHRNRIQERLKFNFFVPVFLPSLKPLGISQETEGHQILMKIEGVPSG